MRAIAVLLVVVFHVFPAAMSGGYVGVDVFFVISGFLICGLILKDAEKNGQFNALSFYDRRIRRLLPAASAVIVSTAMASFFLLPETRLVDTGREIIASTLYVENLYLHFQSINYLTADKLPSPLQHFWSLSIEEQFYIFWPLLMLFTIFMSRKTKLNLRLIVSILLAVIFAGSLIVSIMVTEKNPAGAYFVTHTRIWELAIGGLLACLLPYINLSKAMQFMLSMVGLIMVFSAGLLYTEFTPFPSYTALLPTMGIALMLCAGAISADISPGLVQKILSYKPFTFIGDISYSLYLWHWPIVIFAAAIFGKNFPFHVGVGIIALSIVLATLSKIWLEDPVRKTTKIKTVLESYLLGFSLMAISVIAGLLLIVFSGRGNSTLVPDEATFTTAYPGALAINKIVSIPTDGLPVFIPTLDMVRGDIPTVYAHGCHTARPDTEPTPCYYESLKMDDGTLTMARVDALSGKALKTIVVVGDSHAAQWLPALKEIAARNNYAVISYTKSSCTFVDADIYVAGQHYKECRIWGARVIEQIVAAKPNLLVTSMISNHRVLDANSTEINRAALAQGLADNWIRLGQVGVKVAAIRETPRFKDPVPDCVAENILSPNVCALARDHAMRFSGALAAGVKLADNATLIDMTDYLCTQIICPVVVGNVLVYRDQHHISATYIKTMASALELKIKPLM